MRIPPHCHPGLRHCLRSEGLLNPQLPSQLHCPHHRLGLMRGIGRVETVENFLALTVPGIGGHLWRSGGDLSNKKPLRLQGLGMIREVW